MLNQAEAVAEAIAPVLRSENSPASNEAEVIVEKKVAKVAIAGAGMIGRPGIAAKMFQTLADAGVNLEMISTSEVKVSCVIAEEDCQKAIASLCEAFEIDCSPVQSANKLVNQGPPVRGVALDKNQARFAIKNIPDQPGMAAKIFTELAEKNISIDMIIQSQRCRLVNGVATRDIAFTVAQGDAATARQSLEELATVVGFEKILEDRAIAKVSIVGSGMVGQPGVAARLFAALSEEKINIQMIATSEIKISCVVAEDEGVKALRAVHKAFELAGSEKIIVPA
jgi:aspartate kinase